MELASVKEVRRAAARVTRHLPAEVYTVTRGERERRFKAAIDHFISVLYSADVDGFTEDDFDFFEKLIDLVIPAVEIHLLNSGQLLQPADPDFCEALEHLRIAREGIIRGYPADPAKRPTRESVREQAAARITAMLRDGDISR